MTDNISQIQRTLVVKVASGSTLSGARIGVASAGPLNGARVKVSPGFAPGTSGTVTGGENEGSGVGLLDPATSTDTILKFKTLLQGSNVTITVNDDGTITLSAANGGGTLTGGANEGGEARVLDVDASNASSLVFRTLKGAGETTVTENNDGTITISSTGGGSGTVYTVFGRPGPDITAQSGDYTFGQIDGVPENLVELANLILSANNTLITDGTGTLVQAAVAANTFLARASTGGISAQAVSDFTLSLMSATTQATWRTALGLGTAATRNTDNDPTMAGNSSTVVPTQQAVVGYVTSQIAKVFKLVANWDASGSTFPATGGTGPSGQILAGNLWVINVAGMLGTKAVIAGDMIVAAVDSPGQTQANWVFIEGGLGYIPQAQNAALTQISNAGAATANTFWARASTGLLALKSITDAALSWLATITGTTGTGNTAVLANSPILVTPNLGTPSAINLTNASGTPNINIGGSAVDIAGGTANQIPVQTGAGATGFIAAASAGFLQWTGSAFAWATDVVRTTLANIFTNQQAVTPYRANITGAVTIDLAATAKSNNLHLTLTGNVSSFALTNPVDGAIYNIRFIQDATGNRTLPVMPVAFKFAGGFAPVFSLTANAVDFMSLEYGSTEATYMAFFGKGMA